MKILIDDHEKSKQAFRNVIDKKKQLDIIIRNRAMTAFVNAGGYDADSRRIKDGQATRPKH